MVCIGHNKIHASKAKLNHSVNCVTAAATNTKHFDYWLAIKFRNCFN